LTGFEPVATTYASEQCCCTRAVRQRVKRVVLVDRVDRVDREADEEDERHDAKDAHDVAIAVVVGEDVVELHFDFWPARHGR